MGVLDQLKKLARGHKKEVAEGLDQAADVVEDQVGHKDIVDGAVDVAKDQLGVSQPKARRAGKKK